MQLFRRQYKALLNTPASDLTNYPQYNSSQIYSAYNIGSIVNQQSIASPVSNFAPNQTFRKLQYDTRVTPILKHFQYEERLSSVIKLSGQLVARIKSNK
ncbi:hypothetical protein SS50377_20424 [Spironucleus salmonicida]|uniref:Uncharacterized protein n=1 Tax=Spironucleus salmonicida TaxID=348837 RepID=A0A9P8LZB8_9EUKA|nr:hypothetical protein SS50377_20424 [Spironucleus salmonicida]